MTPSLRHLVLPALLAPALAIAQADAPSTAPAEAPTAEQPEKQPVTREQLELAERLLDAADVFAGSKPGAEVAKPLAKLAGRFADSDPRLIRRNIDLQLKLGATDEALALLGQYRRFDPADELSAVQTIDLNVNKMQAVDQKAKYLQRVFGVDSIPPAVRAHAGVLLYAMQIELGQNAEAAETLSQTLALNPFNPRAVRIAAELAYATSAPAPQRASAVVGVLLSNPMQPDWIHTLARELATVGAADEALRLTRIAFEVANTTGRPTNPDDAINAAALLLSEARGAEALSVSAAATQLAPASPRAWFMRLLAEKQLGQQNFDSLLAEARAALTRNLMALHRRVDPEAPEVTAETAPVMPDVRADAQKLIDAGRADVAQSYVAALGDVAWLDAYFAGQAPDPAVMAAIDTLAGPNSVLATRVQGFAALNTDKLDDALTKFDAIAETDALSRLGQLAVRLKRGDPKPELLTQAQNLLTELPTDVWSSTIRYTLRDLGPIQFSTPDRDEVLAQASRIPDKWLQFASNPADFYLVELRPVRVAVTPGEPIFMIARLQNVGPVPLVVGPGGPVDDTIVIDARSRGALEEYLAAVGIGKFTQRIVLPPKTSMMTYVRIDNNNVTQFLGGTVHMSLSLFPSAVTNARIDDKQNIIPGPGGFRRQATSVIDRPAMAFSQEKVREQLSDVLRKGEAWDRLLAMRTLGDNIRVLQSAQNANEAVQQLTAMANDMLVRAVDKEQSVATRAQGRQLLLGLSRDANQAQGLLATMLSSMDWESQTLGALLTISLPQANRQQLLEPMAKSQDEQISKLAQAIVALPDPPKPEQREPAPTN